jgi:RimJ/RimL family protein N-acetyltransferase
MNLETKRTKIRYLRRDDLEDFFAFRSDPEVCRYQGYDPISRRSAIEFIESLQGKEFGTAGEWVQLGVVHKETGRMIGDVGLKPEADVRVVEFGISFAPEFQGRGLASEAVGATIDRLFDHHRVHRVIGSVDVDNVACIRLMEGLGFRREAHFRNSFFDHGVWRDEYLYAVLASEWKR